MVWQTWNNSGQIVLFWFSFSSLSFPEIGWRLLQDFTTAAWRGEVDVVARMLEDGLPVDIRDVGGDTALHNAAEYNHSDVAQVLLLKGANPNKRDVSGRTALHYAARFNSSGVIKLLLQYGADRSLLNHEGYTPLEIARQWNHKKAERVLELHQGSIS